MVAAEEYISTVGEILSNNGFRYTFKHVREMTLLGSYNDVLLIHASSMDEKMVLTIRMVRDDLNRLRISVRNANDRVRERLETLESRGFSIYEDEDEIAVIGRIPGSRLVDALVEVLRLVK